ncbi:MAG: hypothetical protein V3S14_02260, partial [Anaerolineae bacterium]
MQMKHTRRLITLALLISIAVLLILWSTKPQGTQSASQPSAPLPSSIPSITLPRSDGDAIRDAWTLARQSGVYRFRSQVEQTTYPAPRLTNVGRSSRTDRFALEGQVDQPQDRMEMTLFQDASFNSNDGYSIRIENGQAYGRQGNGEWEEMDNVGDVFAPGGDPLGFLSAARNVRLVGTEIRTIPGMSRETSNVKRQTSDLTNPEFRFSHYAFDLNGPALATYMRDQLEQHLRERGELPAGVDLDTSDVYRKARGQGEVWLDEAGLPRRMTAHLTFPRQRSGEKIEVTYQTDLFDYDYARLARATVGPLEDPATWVVNQLPDSPQAWREFGTQAGLLASTLTTMLLSVTFMRKRAFYVAVVLATVLSMVVTPLLQSHHVAAFNDRVEARRAESKAREAEAEEREQVQAALRERYNWDPHANLLESNVTDQTPNAKRETSNVTSQTPNIQSPLSSIQFQKLSAQATTTSTTSSIDELDTTDTDGDGLIDSEEEDWGTCASADDTACDDPTDSDGDGLNDYTEVYHLGTHPALTDTDGDSITDTLEIEGFYYNSQQWYLNPLEADTNGDGLLDGQECQALSILRSSGTGGSVCVDTDGDGDPDVFDYDNDNDGVPDAVDLSPNQYIGDSSDFFDYDNPFFFSIDNLTAGEPVFVELQLRPVNTDHLYYSGSVLDWPRPDTGGQVMRYKSTTFADTDNASLRSNDDNASNGDMTLVPMLEIKITDIEGNYGNLPTITDTENITDTGIEYWLDKDALDAYGISVQQEDETDDLYVYVPLTTIEDDIGGARSAFSAQMLYWPGGSDWGDAHQYRVLWMVQVIVNEDGNAGDTSQIAHIYTDEEWTITGLDVLEDHGFEIAIAAEDPAVDPDDTQEDQFWQLAESLSVTFVEGIDCVPASQEATTCTSDGTRLTVNEIAERFNHSTNNSIDDRYRWYITDTIRVITKTYAHQGYFAHVAMTDTVSFLDTYYGSKTDAVPLLLFASEQTYRSINLDDIASGGTLTGTLVVDIDQQETLVVATLASGS